MFSSKIGHAEKKTICFTILIITFKKNIYLHTYIFRFLLRKPAIMPQEKATPSQALKWCQNFLRGAWSTITVEQMQMTRVS